MLSKEEIEKTKEDFNFFNEGDYITKEMANSKEQIFEYIKELEADNYEQNNIINDYIDERRELIEKLEERIKEYKEKSGGNTYHIQSMINAEIRELEWVLSILKGENQVTVK